MKQTIELKEAYANYEKLSNKSMIKISPSVQRDTQKQVDFLEVIIKQLWMKLDGVDPSSITTTTTSTSSTSDVQMTTSLINDGPIRMGVTKMEFLEICFIGNAFSINGKSNYEIKWAKMGIENSNFQNSKPTINNFNWLPKIEKVRLCLMKLKNDYAINDFQKTYEPSWRDLYRVPMINDMMNQEIGRLLTKEGEARRLFYSHGFNKVAPYVIALEAYKKCNFIILRTFANVEKLFDRAEFMNPVSNGSKQEIINLAFQNGKHYKTFQDIEDGDNVKAYSQQTYLEFGMHLSVFKLRENPVFVLPNIDINVKAAFEEILCTALNNIMATVNKLMNKNLKTNYTYADIWDERKSGDLSNIRQATKIIMRMKQAIDRVITPNRNRFLARPINNSSNVVTGTPLL